MHGRGRIGVEQRHGPLCAGYQSGRPTGATSQVLAQEADVAERGRHQQELGMRQLQEGGYLPGPAAVGGVAVEMELIHHDNADVGVRSFAKRDVGQYLRGAGDDRRARIDRGIAGEHAHVRAPNVAHSAKNFSLTSALIGAV